MPVLRRLSNTSSGRCEEICTGHHLVGPPRQEGPGVSRVPGGPGDGGGYVRKAMPHLDGPEDLRNAGPFPISLADGGQDETWIGVGDGQGDGFKVAAHGLSILPLSGSRTRAIW